MPAPSQLIDDIRDMLLDCGLLNSLTPNELLSAAGYFNVSTYTPDQNICLEGDAGTFMCIIHAGAVSVRKINSAGETIELAKLRKGRAFGEMAVLDGERRSASCIAVSDCSVLILAKDSLDKMLSDAPKTAAKVIRAIAIAMSRRLRMADGQLVEQQL
ncbi:Crp/Fnr family transcriptional regulator [Pseudomonas leptonychotis]|uniref:Crp/Fnr family transcriptional regulator n=1 Tax=Pseudomonas leptonychotis TaxID=2448482 RepID=UPI003868EB50